MQGTVAEALQNPVFLGIFVWPERATIGTMPANSSESGRCSLFKKLASAATPSI